MLARSLPTETQSPRSDASGVGTMGLCGLLAQLVERLVYTEDVGGSSPSGPTIRMTRVAVSVVLPSLVKCPRVSSNGGSDVSV